MKLLGEVRSGIILVVARLPMLSSLTLVISGRPSRDPRASLLSLRVRVTLEDSVEVVVTVNISP